MVSITDLSFYFGSRPLYKDANLHIKPKDRIGLIGPNGQGKSTLLKIITGDYAPDSGSVSMAKDCSIGFLNQDLLSYQSDASIREVAMMAFTRALEVQASIEDILKKLETDYSDEMIEDLGKLQAEFEALDGYTLESRTDEVLEGLGFNTADLSKPLRQFSGGWRMRVMLAKLLLAKPNLLLLDEPTNHLDLPSIQWIEEYLQDYEGAIVTVSHDREFLNRLCNTIVEVSGGKLVAYAGNYNFYVEEKEQRKEIQKGAFENQQAQIRQAEKFIDTFRAKASKARQVQSRVKALERIDLVEDVVDDNARVNFRFKFSQPSGRQVVELKKISKSYGTNKVLDNTSLTLERGSKVALVGANGKGKTTLLRIIAGEEPIEGDREIGYNVRDSFFAQHQLEALNVENTVIEELKQAGSGKTEQELRGVLGCFLFTDEDVFKKIKVLSGGEKSRVALAKTLISEANFLLLDEPTNHLDMQSVNILIQALQQYEGTFVVVSHDRHFVSQIANTIWYIEDRHLKQYPGTWDEYLYWSENLRPHPSTTAKADNGKMANPSQSTPTAKPAAKTDAAAADKKKLNTLEDDIAILEKERDLARNTLGDETLYKDSGRLKSAQQALFDIEQALRTKTTEWEALVERIG
jgi:ATP-binding cassette subfamily F protein 3